MWRSWFVRYVEETNRVLASLNVYLERRLGEGSVQVPFTSRTRAHAMMNALQRLSEALVNTEIIDLTHHNTLEELGEAKEKIAQLSGQNARYVGIDSRLATALQEKDDMQQEFCTEDSDEVNITLRTSMQYACSRYRQRSLPHFSV